VCTVILPVVVVGVFFGGLPTAVSLRDCDLATGRRTL